MKVKINLNILKMEKIILEFIVFTLLNTKSFYGACMLARAYHSLSFPLSLSLSLSLSDWSEREVEIEREIGIYIERERSERERDRDIYRESE